MILDASIFIEAERDTFDLAGFLASAGEEPVAIAAITASELLHGVERATDPAARARRHDFVESILADFPVLVLLEAVAHDAGPDTTLDDLNAALDHAERTSQHQPDTESRDERSMPVWEHLQWATK